MADTVVVEINGTAMEAVVLITPYGVRIKVDAERAYQAGAHESERLMFKPPAGEEGEFLLHNRYDVPPTVWLALRRLAPGEIVRSKYKQPPRRPTLGEVRYG